VSQLTEVNPEDVMAWWLHTDLSDEWRARLEGRGAFNFSTSSDTTMDGPRTRTTQYIDRKGWVHYVHNEKQLNPDGKATRSGDRFFISLTDVHRLQFGKKKLTLTSNGRIEFVPQAKGNTEVRMVLNLILEGPRFQRWVMKTIPQNPAT
jgi:hypothetical protein